MEPVIKSSFIPSDTETVAVPKRIGGGGMTDLLMLAAVVFFIASAALAAGVFFYAEYLEKSKISKSASLERARAAFEPALIENLTRLDDRMRIADEVLGAHIAPSILFRVLEQVTLQTVSFRTLTLDANDAKNITVRMRGVAGSVNAIALQADLFTKNGIITSPIFSNIDRELGGVNFDVSALLNPYAIRYTSLFAAAGGVNGAPTSEVPTPERPVEFDPFGGGEDEL